MKRWLSNGILGALGLAGCVVWTGCGGGGGHTVMGATDLRFVRTAESPGVVNLAWTPSPEKSLLGYSLQRRTAAEQTYTLVTNRLIQGTNYTDQLPDPNDTRTMYYQVIAVGSNGRLGVPTEVATIVSPPAPPGGF